MDADDETAELRRNRTRVGYQVRVSHASIRGAYLIVAITDDEDQAQAYYRTYRDQWEPGQTVWLTQIISTEIDVTPGGARAAPNLKSVSD